MKRFLVYLRKIKNLNAKKKAYVCVFLALGLVLLWAFFSAGFLTHGFSRSQIKTGENRQELDVSSMILTETKEDKKFWEIYGETGTYNSDQKLPFPIPPFPSKALPARQSLNLYIKEKHLYKFC